MAVVALVSGCGPAVPPEPEPPPEVPCDVRELHEVDWTERNATGRSGADVIARLEALTSAELVYEHDARPDSTVQLRFARGPGSPTREVVLFRQHTDTRCDDHLYVPVELRVVSDDGALDATVVGIAEPHDGSITSEFLWTQAQESGWIVELFPSNVEDQGLFLYCATFDDGRSEGMVASSRFVELGMPFDLRPIAQFHGTLPSARP